MKKIFLLMIMHVTFSLAAHAEPIQGGDKDTVWMRYTNSTAYWVQISHTNKYIAKGGGGTFFYDFKTGALLKTLGGSAQGYFNNDDSQFIRINQTGTGIDIVDLNSWKVVDSLKMGEKSLRANAAANISKDGRYFIGEVEGGLNIWDIETRKAVYFLSVKSDDLHLSELQYAGFYLNCDFTKAYVHVWKIFKPDNNPEHNYTLRYLITYNLQTGDSMDVHETGYGTWLSNNCQLYATNYFESTNGVKIFDLNTKQLLWTLPTNGANCSGMEFSTDDKYLFVSHSMSSDLNAMEVWDVSNGKLIYKYNANPGGGYNCFDISEDGKYIAASYSIILWLYKTDGINGIIDPKNPQDIIYPNPTNNQIHITFNLPNPGITDISVANETGKNVKQLFSGMLSQGTQRMTYDVKGLPPGSYFVQIQNKTYSKVFKLIINK